MNATELHHKTVRPGSLNGYSYYYSNRRPTSNAQTAKGAKPAKSHRKGWLMLALLIAVPVLVYGLKFNNKPPAATADLKQVTTTAPKSTVSKTPAVAAPATTNQCDGNTLDKFIKVDISDRKLWACEGSKQVYTAPVVTGMEMHPSTLTPPGTYHISGMATDQTLTGTDETGSWNDPVSYWMPFLYNQYGAYGFHDATWRDNSDFGKISPNSDQASHGCVELPLGAAGWIYNWADVGTTVTIQA
jgi:lipoprotein-anchoring transpeptidase ErfK/SrfK